MRLAAGDERWVCEQSVLGQMKDFILPLHFIQSLFLIFSHHIGAGEFRGGEAKTPAVGKTLIGYLKPCFCCG